MKIIDNFDVTSYGIVGFKTHSASVNADINSIRYTPLYEELKEGFAKKRNKNLITMIYGDGKAFDFDKSRAYDLLLAIRGVDRVVNQLGIDKNIFEKFCEMNGVENVLNDTLKGSAVFVVTIKNADNVIGITGMDKNVQLIAKNTEDLFLSEHLIEQKTNNTEAQINLD